MLEEDTARPSDLSGVVPWERERMGGGAFWEVKGMARKERVRVGEETGRARTT